MTPRLTSSRCALLLALLAAAAQPGCVTAPKLPEAAATASAAFRTSYTNARTEGR